MSIETLVIDDREPDKMQEFLEEEGLDTEIERLEVGDYVYGEIGIERKTINDFSKFGSSRLWKQALKLRETFEYPYILMSGTFKELRDWKLKRPVLGAMGRLGRYEELNGYGLPVLGCDSDRDLAFLIKCLIEDVQKGERPQPVKMRKAEPQEIKEDMIRVLPRIGLKKAQKIQDKIGIANLFDASEDNLMKIEGIGKKTAQKIGKLLGGD